MLLSRTKAKHLSSHNHHQIWKHLLAFEAYSPMKRLVRNRTRTAGGNRRNFFLKKTAKWIMATLQSHPSQVAAAGGKMTLHSLPPAQHGANRLGDWSGETVASHGRGCMAFLEGLCTYLASWMVICFASRLWANWPQTVSFNEELEFQALNWKPDAGAELNRGYTAPNLQATIRMRLRTLAFSTTQRKFNTKSTVCLWTYQR